MTYKPLRRDLTETTQQCGFCPNFLTSLKAYVLEDLDTGDVKYAGPVCAENNIGPEETLKGLPDLTKFTSATNEGHGGGIGGGGNHSNDDPRRRALEYLELRESKLVDDMKTSYAVLRAYYLKSKTGELSDEEVMHINRLEAKAPDGLKLERLQKCYNYLFWIDVGIQKLKEDKTDFLKNIRAVLVKKGDISDGQRDAVNKWLKNIEGVPQLK